MSPAARFDEPIDAQRMVLSLGGELAGIEMWASCAGFQLKTEDQSPLLDDEPASLRTTEWLDWEGVWRAIDRYRWVRYRLLHVDPLIADELRARAQVCLAAEPEHAAGYATERWNERWDDIQAGR